MTTDSIHASPSRTGQAPGRTVSSWVAALIALVAAVLGLGAGYLVFAPEPAEFVDTDVERLLDDYWAAFSARDAAAIRALMTEDGEWFGTPVAEAEALEARMAMLDNGLVAARVGDPTVTSGEGWGARWYEVAQKGTYGDGSDPDESLYLIYLVEQDDVLRMSSIETIGGGY